MISRLLNRFTFWYYRKSIAVLLIHFIDNTDKGIVVTIERLDKIFKELQWKPKHANTIMTILQNSGTIERCKHPLFNKRLAYRIKPEILK